MSGYLDLESGKTSMDRLFKFIVSFFLLAFLSAVMYVLATMIVSAAGTGTIRALAAGAVVMLIIMVIVLMYIYSLFQEWRFESAMIEAKELFKKDEFEKAGEACQKAEKILNDEDAILEVLKFREEIYLKIEDQTSLKDVRDKIKSLQEEAETA